MELRPFKGNKLIELVYFGNVDFTYRDADEQNQQDWFHLNNTRQL